MSERRLYLWARLLILGNTATICRSRISDGGAPPKDDGAISELLERRLHLWAHLLILGNAAVICRRRI